MSHRIIRSIETSQHRQGVPWLLRSEDSSSFFVLYTDSRYLVFVDDHQIRAWDLATDDVRPLEGLEPEKRRPITWGDLATAFKIDPAYPVSDIIALPCQHIGFWSVPSGP